MERILQLKEKNKMNLIIDRFEGDYAIVVDENMNNYDIPKELIPNSKDNDTVKITVIPKEDNKEIDHLMDELFN